MPVPATLPAIGESVAAGAAAESAIDVERGAGCNGGGECAARRRGYQPRRRPTFSVPALTLTVLKSEVPGPMTLSVPAPFLVSVSKVCTTSRLAVVAMLVFERVGAGAADHGADDIRAVVDDESVVADGEIEGAGRRC